MYLETITISINYPDYLDRIAVNAKHFDRWLIVTHEDDLRTIDVCRRNKLEFLVSKRIHENGAVFAKGKAINEGLLQLEQKNWLLHMDSDILLPPNFREMLESKSLDVACIYGMAERCIALKESHIKRRRFPRTLTSKEILGFFQLFHSSRMSRYPEVSSDPSLDDQIFTSSWPEERRIIMDAGCIHLGEPRLNWNRRVTPKFGAVLNRHTLLRYCKMGLRSILRGGSTPTPEDEPLASTTDSVARSCGSGETFKP